MNMSERLSFSIAGWLTLSRDTDVSLGLSREDARGRAKDLRHLIGKGLVTPGDVRSNELVKDILWALPDALANAEHSSDDAVAAEANSIYKWLQQLVWPDDSLGELNEIRCACAFVGWQACRRAGFPRAAQTWMMRYEHELAGAEALRITGMTFLETLASGSAAISAVTVPLAFTACALLRQIRDRRAKFSTTAAARLHVRLMKGTDSSLTAVERSYLLGETALIAASGSRLLGRFAHAIAWAAKAREAFLQLRSPEELLVNVDYVLMTIRYEAGEIELVLDYVDSLIARFESAGVRRGRAKCLLLKADMLKLAGRLDEQEKVVETLLAITPAEPDLNAAALLKAAELRVIRGEFEDATQLLSEAAAVLEDAESPMFAALMTATSGELERQRGNLAVALELFGQALTQFDSLGMTTMAPRIRLQRGELLLAMDRPVDAEGELRTAARLSEALGLMPERAAARLLLAQSMERTPRDPVRSLRRINR